MMKLSAVRRSLFIAAALAACQAACGSSSDGSSPGSGAGAGGALSGAGATGTSAGAANAGSPGAGAPNAGAAGAVTAAGASGSPGGGAANGGSAGTAGVSGSAGMAGSGGAPPFGVIKCNPTASATMDGKHDLASTTQAPAEWTLQNGATAGKVTAKASYVSPNYTPGHFSYWIYTSANYVMGSPAVFLMFGDGNQFLTDFHAATVLDNLTAAKDLPPTVALFVDPPSDGTNAPTEGDRQQAYDPPTDKYTTLLFSELLPALIFDKYSISRDPNAWAVGGYSASGGQGWKVLWNKPDQIHKFVGISASFGAAITYDNWDWVAVVSAAPARPLRVSLLASTKDLSDARGNWLTINTNMQSALAAKGDQTRLMVAQATCGTDQCGHYPPLDGEHDFPAALRWTFQGCTF